MLHSNTIGIFTIYNLLNKFLNEKPTFTDFLNGSSSFANNGHFSMSAMSSILMLAGRDVALHINVKTNNTKTLETKPEVPWKCEIKIFIHKMHTQTLSSHSNSKRNKTLYLHISKHVDNGMTRKSK